MDISHPELRNGEVFFRNMNEAQFELLTWHTKRRGITAYDEQGRMINYDNWFPVFVRMSELVNLGMDIRDIYRSELVKSS